LREVGSSADGAVVENVTIAVADPPELMVTDCPELQFASEGKPVQFGVIMTAPLLVNPFCDTNVSCVDPDCPGAETVTVVGFAEIEKPGGPVTVTVRGADVELAKFVLPPKLAVIWSCPAGRDVVVNTAWPFDKATDPRSVFPPLVLKNTTPPKGVGPPGGEVTTVAVNVTLCP